MKNLRILLNGLLKENPVFVLLLGICPVLAVTTNAQNAVGIGVLTALVLAVSNAAVSAMRKLIPRKARTAAYIIIIAGIVSATDMLFKAYFPELSERLGIFVPLIAVNCIILSRAEAFALENGIVKTLLDSLGMGLGFIFALVLMAAVREILGNGTFWNVPLFGGGSQPAAMLLLPPGAFLVLGILLALINLLTGMQNRQSTVSEE